mmetsp:Transcript_111006/g.264876  ORF Transcript_111006/g.264876 Transcript_111006/m.264876 type:complete len:288 (-) Transcript_111006:133-996(-)
MASKSLRSAGRFFKDTVAAVKRELSAPVSSMCCCRSAKHSHHSSSELQVPCARRPSSKDTWPTLRRSPCSRPDSSTASLALCVALSKSFCMSATSASVSLKAAVARLATSLAAKASERAAAPAWSCFRSSASAAKSPSLHCCCAMSSWFWPSSSASRAMDSSRTWCGCSSVPSAMDTEWCKLSMSICRTGMGKSSLRSSSAIFSHSSERCDFFNTSRCTKKLMRRRNFLAANVPAERPRLPSSLARSWPTVMPARSAPISRDCTSAIRASSGMSASGTGTSVSSSCS